MHSPILFSISYKITRMSSRLTSTLEGTRVPALLPVKFLSSSVAALSGRESSREKNFKLLGRFFLTLVGMVVIFSVIFHVLMAWEGQQHSWLTGFYWSFTVMSTLGFGDITFQSDIGRLFSIFVLLSGVIFLLILLPFTLIEFFYCSMGRKSIEANRQIQYS